MQFKINHGIIVNVDGGLAQLGERLPYKQRVGGSSPSASTMNKRETDSNLINKAEPFFYNISLRATRAYPFRWRILFFIHDTNDAHIDRMTAMVAYMQKLYRQTHKLFSEIMQAI